MSRSASRSAHSPTTESQMSSKASHILIVEDEPVTRKTLASYLDSFGYRVSETDSAEEAEAILARDAPDLLLVDINLKGRDGLEITRDLRSRSEIGIILISGRTDEVDRIIGLELGADDYVCKPFNRASAVRHRCHRQHREELARFRQSVERPDHHRRCDWYWQLDSVRQQDAASDSG